MDLKRIQTLQKETWGWVYDVALLPNVGIVLACSNGLLQINDVGDTVNKIDSGDFTSIDIDDGTLYASDYEMRLCTATYRAGMLGLSRLIFYTLAAASIQ